jgi:hypothetical protein
MINSRSAGSQSRRRMQPFFFAFISCLLVVVYWWAESSLSLSCFRQLSCTAHTVYCLHSTLHLLLSPSSPSLLPPSGRKNARAHLLPTHPTTPQGERQGPRRAYRWRRRRAGEEGTRTEHGQAGGAAPLPPSPLRLSGRGASTLLCRRCCCCRYIPPNPHPPSPIPGRFLLLPSVQCLLTRSIA